MKETRSNIKPLRCLVVDDESIARQGLEEFINNIDFLQFVRSCSSAIEAAEVLRNEDIDLLFLDIQMPHLSGLDFLESLPNAPMTIFCTAYSEYALDGFRLQVVDYLLKPISFKRFFQAANKALDLYLLKKENDADEVDSSMFVRQEGRFVRIDWREILYVEAMQNYIKLHFKERTLIILQTMSSMENELPSDVFFRVHKSYLVNIHHIELISGGRIFINGEELPISRHRKDDLLNSVVYKKLLNK